MQKSEEVHMACRKHSCDHFLSRTFVVLCFALLGGRHTLNNCATAVTQTPGNTSLQDNTATEHILQPNRTDIAGSGSHDENGVTGVTSDVMSHSITSDGPSDVKQGQHFHPEDHDGALSDGPSGVTVEPDFDSKVHDRALPDGPSDVTDFDSEVHNGALPDGPSDVTIEPDFDSEVHDGALPDGPSDVTVEPDFDSKVHDRALPDGPSDVTVEPDFDSEVRDGAQPDDQCSRAYAIPIVATEGTIYITHPGKYPKAIDDCRWQITVPQGRFIVAEYEVILENCLADISVLVRSPGEARSVGYYYCHDENVIDSVSFSSANQLLFQLNVLYDVPVHNVTMFKIHFQTTDIQGQTQLSAGFRDGGRNGYSQGTDAYYELVVPPQHVVMISFLHFDLYDVIYAWSCVYQDDFVEIHTQHNGTSELVERICGHTPLPPQVFETSLALRFVTDDFGTGTGFQMLFSFHLDTEAPRKLENGLFDCSLPHYTSFKQHLECNLELECQNGEDEENCPFSSPACNGSVAFNNKCYTSVKSDLFLSWNGADAECKSRGGNLAVMTSQGEWDAVEKIFQYGRSWAPAYVGFRRVDATMPGMYSKMWMWSDRTLAYSVDIDYANLQELFEYGCGFISPELPRQLRATLCSISGAKHFVCEMVVEEEEVPSPRESVTSPDLRLSRFTRLPVIGCPGGHMTHDFLSCDLNSACGGEGRSKTCNVPAKYDAISDDDRPDVVTVGLFMCDDDETTLPYTLVCDYRSDCPDRSDQDFCHHGAECPDFTCTNGQCVTFSERCDGKRQCWDGSDEDNCPGIPAELFFLRVDDDKQFPGIVRCLPSPTVISFDGRGNFTQLP
ncbi:hypothetical protein BaRGS_00025690, partial [Batillaria attramentaria]